MANTTSSDQDRPARKEDRFEVLGSALLVVSPFIVLLVLAVALGVICQTIVERREQAEAERRADIAAAVKGAYGGVVISDDYPAALGREVEGVVIRLPGGAARCDVTVGSRASQVTLLCGPDEVEPPLR